MEKDRKKKIIALLVLVVISTLSIAFASISRTLNINGTAKMDTALWDVHFDNLSKANLINTAEEVSVPNYADNKGTIENINVKLKNPKDEVIYTVDIVNDGTMDAEVTVTSLTELTEEESKLFDFGVYYSDGTKITKYDLLEAGKSKEVTIKLRYKDDITEFDLPEVPLTISFGFTINYIQSDASMVVTPNGDLENVVSTLAKGANTASTSTFFNGNITKESVESITFFSTLKVPADAKQTAWDASEAKDGSVIAWYTDLDENSLYELNIGGNGKVYAPETSAYLFKNFTKLKTINFNNVFDTSNVTTMAYMFSSSKVLTSLDLSSFDTSNVTNMSWMFEWCCELEKLNVSGFDTHNVTNMSNMFNRCWALKNIDLSNFDTHNVTNMSGMFFNTGLLSLDMNTFDTSKVTNMQDMFMYSSLTSLDLSNFNTTNVTNMSGMFYGCSSLMTLNLSNFTTNENLNLDGIFFNCTSLNEIYLNSADLSLAVNINAGSFWYVPNGFTVYVLNDTSKNIVLNIRSDANVIIQPLSN